MDAPTSVRDRDRNGPRIVATGGRILPSVMQPCVHRTNSPLRQYLIQCGSKTELVPLYHCPPGEQMLDMGLPEESIDASLETERHDHIFTIYL